MHVNTQHKISQLMHVCRPTCRLFVENQLCCQSEGLLTSATYANLRVLCNQPVTLSPDCISVEGPSNVTVLDVLNGNPTYSHQFLVNYEDSDYYGHVNLNLEQQRWDAHVINLHPCKWRINWLSSDIICLTDRHGRSTACLLFILQKV